MVEFYWESKGQKYRFSRKKKYIVYYRGCFSPPHAGHMQVMKDILSHSKNIFLVIHQHIGEKSHGLPKSFCREMLKYYRRKCLSERCAIIYNEEDLLQFDGDIVVYLRFDEGNFTPPLPLIEKFAKMQYLYIIKTLKKREIKFCFWFPYRYGENSSSLFIKEIKRTKSMPFSKRYKILCKFFPDSISEKRVEFILTNMDLYKLK